MRALHFGAGNIGRGFIGKILAENGFEVIFADVVPVLIDNLRDRKTFKVNVVDESGCKVEVVTITGAVFSNKDEVLDEIINADLITTAVGPRILERLAPSLAKGLTKRREAGITKPLNIIACENAIRATQGLQSFVYKELDADTLEWAKQNVGFVDCAVDRIVPPARHEDPLEVTVESFCEWVIESKNIKGEFPELPNLKVTDNLNAFVERKLMTVNTGHAVCAYLGKLYGHKEIRTAVLDPKVRTVVEGAMRESGAALVSLYGMDAVEHEAYIQKILRRYANPYIKDDVDRVGREPIRKLSSNDRLVKPMLSCVDLGLPRENLLTGIAAALLYRNSEDPQAVELAGMVNTEGMIGALCKVSGLNVDKPGTKSSLTQVEAMLEVLRNTSAVV